MNLDWNNRQGHIEKIPDGTMINVVQLTDLPLNLNVKQIGTKLNELADNVYNESFFL